MHTIEFWTKIKDGMIKIPREHRNKIKENVRVIIFTDENRVESDFIEKLMKNPIKLRGFTPLSRDEIYDRN